MSASYKPLDYWLPPEGAGRPLACLATSFTFDPDFFESQCLGRFLNLDWKRDEGDELAFLIEQEEKLAETRASVLVDRSYNPEGRSLRWDVLPVGVRSGVMHAKVSLLVWERLVRAMVGSANLTPAGYRSQLEAVAVLDAHEAADVPALVFDELLVALRSLVGRAAGRVDRPGPKQRALETLDDAAQRLDAFGLRRRGPRALPRLSIVAGEPGRPVLDGIGQVWRGGPARRAVVMSPFFDGAGAPSPAVGALAARLAARGSSEATFVVAAETLESQTTVRAPETLVSSLPARTRGRVRELRQPDDGEFRRLHAKVLVLENDAWTAAIVGSSNFTAAGLSIGGRGNLEINLAYGTPSRSSAASELRALAPAGREVDLDDAAWEPEPPEDELREPELPWGFAQALLDPAPPPGLRLQLVPSELPPSWSILDPSGRSLTDDAAWKRARRPAELKLTLPDEALPFFLTVRWDTEEGLVRATWPVNVADAGDLPPPEELRNLPVDALLKALASTRPLHESLSQALREREAAMQAAELDELDPLKRFSSAGHLLARAKQVSLALAGLHSRLERPAANEEALEWRLTGPFGPRAIAEGLIEQAHEDGAVPGEASFLLAELALTLSRVDWASTGKLLPGGTRTARRYAREALAELRSLHDGVDDDPRLAEYVGAAFKKATL